MRLTGCSQVLHLVWHVRDVVVVSTLNLYFFCRHSLSQNSHCIKRAWDIKRVRDEGLKLDKSRKNCLYFYIINFLNKWTNTWSKTFKTKTIFISEMWWSWVRVQHKVAMYLKCVLKKITWEKVLFHQSMYTLNIRVYTYCSFSCYLCKLCTSLLFAYLKSMHMHNAVYIYVFLLLPIFYIIKYKYEPENEHDVLPLNSL